MNQLLEILGVITGVIYLWLEYKASIYLWIAGIIMPTIYIFVYYNAGLYADFGINIYYLLIASQSWAKSPAAPPVCTNKTLSSGL